MSMILFSGHGSRCNTLRIGLGSWVTAALVFGVMLPGAAYWAGSHFNSAADAEATAADNAAVQPDTSAPIISEQEIERRVQQRINRHITDMAPRLARLQAESVRLDAIANRLIKDNGEDPDDFRQGSGGPETADSRDYTSQEFDSALTRLSDTFHDQQALFERIDSALADHRLQAEIMPSGWPIDGGWVSSPYGVRTDPITGKKSSHHGVDIAAKRYTPIKTVAAGIVSFAGRKTGYGRVVEVTHGNGYTTLYAHTQAFKVKVGDRVKKGQTIALVGSSGRATGPHLHFEVRSNGNTINPSRFLRASR